MNNLECTNSTVDHETVWVMRGICGTRGRTAAAALTLALLLAGCGGGAAPPPPDEDPQASTTPRAFDPPSDFGPPIALLESGGEIPLVRALDGLSGWAIGSTGLTRVDFATNVVQPGSFPDNRFDPGVALDRRPSGGSSQLGDPVISETPAGRLAMGAFPVEIEGRGTVPRSKAIELVTADAATAQRLFNVTVPLPDSEITPGRGPGIRAVRLAGVRDGIAVVSAETLEGGLTAGIDLVNRRVTWTAPDLVAQLVVGDTVIAERPDEVDPEMQGLGISDGGRRWGGVTGGTAYQVGNELVMIAQTSFAPGKSGTSVVEAATGRERDTSLTKEGSWRCKYDQRSITVCQLSSGSRPYAIVALDNSGREMWRIVRETGGSRVPPAVTAAWHGAVYGYTDAGPVVLDASTGADRTPAAAAAPILVNEYYGVTPAPGRTPESPLNYDNPGRLSVVPTAS